ncbi:MAG: DUF3098 domain-containing protein [Bacteroidota bacterium]|nr:DUF3098 domain-containing protein [Bacteroidota bacterium]
MKTQPITKATPAAQKAPVAQAPAKPQPDFLFGKENYKWMIIGAVILALGFFLMAGGKSPDPNVFNDNVIYSPVRITVAPILIIAGFVVEIFAIMKKPK